MIVAFVILVFCSVGVWSELKGWSLSFFLFFFGGEGGGFFEFCSIVTQTKFATFSVDRSSGSRW